MDTRKRIFTVGLVALALVAGIAAGQQDNSVVKLKFAKDTTLKYKTVTTSKMDFMGQTMEMTMDTTQTTSVLDQKEGWTTLRVVTDDVKSQGDGTVDIGSSLDALKGVAVKMEVDENGTTRNVAIENIDKLDPMTRQIMEGTYRGVQAAGYMGLYFPKDGITSGSKWNTVIDAEKFVGKNEMVTSIAGKIPVDFEVVGFEDIDGKRNVKVNVKMTGTINMGIASPVGDLNAVLKLVSNATNWVDVATGFLTKSETTMQSDNDFGMGSMTQQVNTKISRVN